MSNHYEKLTCIIGMIPYYFLLTCRVYFWCLRLAYTRQAPNLIPFHAIKDPHTIHFITSIHRGGQNSEPEEARSENSALSVAALLPKVVQRITPLAGEELS